MPEPEIVFPDPDNDADYPALLPKIPPDRLKKIIEKRKKYPKKGKPVQSDEPFIVEPPQSEEK